MNATDNRTTEARARFEQAKCDNPSHPYLQQRKWDDLSDEVKASWVRLMEAERDAG